jgi:hypothetical protein
LATYSPVECGGTLKTGRVAPKALSSYGRIAWEILAVSRH